MVKFNGRYYAGSCWFNSLFGDGYSYDIAIHSLGKGKFCVDNVMEAAPAPNKYREVKFDDYKMAKKAAIDLCNEHYSHFLANNK